MSEPHDATDAGAFNRYTKDYYGGGLMFLLGVGAIYKGMDYHVGTLHHMGPGYFPVAVGAVLALMGILIALSARASAPAAARTQHVPQWRGWFCIIAGNVAFVVLGRYGGLVPATFAIVFIAALGDRQNSVRSSFLLALAMVVVSLVVFTWALKLQLAPFQWK